MKTWILGGALFASALALAACGGGSDNGSAGSNEAAPANAAAPADEGNAAAGDNAGAGEEGGGSEAAAGGAQQDFTLVNNTGRTLMTLNVSANDQNEWGPDILGTQTVANGASGTVQFARGQDQCLWDIRATFEDGQAGDWRGVNLCETTTITLTPTG
ncbi:MAG TPA: hypothetical protein VEW25_06445 [Allosphingosinicella sp.]|nr:hypothetical protein [Allosphingosinicella sp.]